MKKLWSINSRWSLVLAACFLLMASSVYSQKIGAREKDIKLSGREAKALLLAWKSIQPGLSSTQKDIANYSINIVSKESDWIVQFWPEKAPKYSFGGFDTKLAVSVDVWIDKRGSKNVRLIKPQ